MKRSLPLFCALALFAFSCTSGSGPADGPRVMVLGIDGATWTVIEPMMEAGELPNLKKLYDSGLHGILESRPPIISPVVWTTIFTGFGHAKHGVKDWKTSQSVNRRVNAVWEILRGTEKKVDVLNVPGTWPPDAVNGVMMAGFPLSGATFGGNTGEILTMEKLNEGKLSVAFRDNAPAIREAVAKLAVGQWSPWIDGKLASRPTFAGSLRAFRLTDDLVYLTPLYRTDDELVVSEPKTLRGELAKKIGEPYIPEGPGWSKWADEHTPAVLYPHLEQVFSIQSKGALEYVGGDWDLFLYVMTLVDRVSHPYWAYAYPENFPDMDLEKAKRFSTAVADSYRRSDEELGKLLAGVKGRPPYVVIVSDHGFQSSQDLSKAVGAHNPSGIYLVSGPGITPKTGSPKFIEDVTPTLLYLMGLPTGQDMDGRVFAEVAEMLARPIESVPTYETGERDATDEPVDADTWESLRGLGYVDGAPPRAEDRKKAAEGEGDPGDSGDDDADSGAAGAAGSKKKTPGMAPGRVAPKPAPPKNGAPPAGAAQKEAPPVPDALEDWPDDSDH